MSKFKSILAFGVLLAVPASLCCQQGTAPAQVVTIDARAAATPFPHSWEQMFGSGRANLALRAGYRSDLGQVKQITGLQYVRFHGILDDENGVYSQDAQGNPIYNWSYVDQIYDGLLAAGARPYVEISFMPKALAKHLDYQNFWYKPIASPPGDYSKWDALIPGSARPLFDRYDYSKWDALVAAFARHLIDRYGIDEISNWYFEVWNEPNLGFWTGVPPEQTYFELYDHTARALKAASPRIRVGGPATAQAAWVGDIIAHTTQNHVPLDFVSSHAYGNDSSEDVFHDHRSIAPYQMVCHAVQKVHDEIEHSARPKLPLVWSEFNASFKNQQEITDSIFMGPWLADTIRQCDGLTAMMSYWTFSDVFEEQGVVRTPFYGGYGLLAEDGIPKPAFDAFELLHTLGNERIPVATDDVLATRREKGILVIAAWNLVEPGVKGADKTIDFNITGTAANVRATIRRLDAAHGDTLDAWKRMGSPKYPTQAQIATLRNAAEIGPPEVQVLRRRNLRLTLPPMGLALIEIR